MKNYVKIIVIAALATINGFSVIACATANTGIVVSDIACSTGKLVGIDGSVVITGLDEFKGYFVYAQGFIKDALIYAAADVSGTNNNLTATGIKIENDVIILPVWAISYNYDEEKKIGNLEKTPFDGDGGVFLMLTISEHEDFHWQSSSTFSDITLFVTFNNGGTVIIFGDGEKSEGEEG